MAIKMKTGSKKFKLQKNKIKKKRSKSVKISQSKKLENKDIDEEWDENNDIDDDDDDDLDLEEVSNPKKWKSNSKPVSNDDHDSESSEAQESDDESIMDATMHKKTLESLKEKDPEFYEYLQKHDKQLLDFNDDEELPLDDDGENLDQSDDEDSEESETFNITIDNVKEWKQILQNPTTKTKCLNAIKSSIKAFRKSVQQTQDSSDQMLMKPMSVMNPSLFNMIINTCLVDLLPAISHYLGLKVSPDSQNEDDKIRCQLFDPRRSRNWKRIISSMKMYLTDILKMMTSLSIEARLSFERHILELIPYYQVFPHLIKRIIRHSIQEWHSSQEERSRVLAFLILYRTIRVIQTNENHMTNSERETFINQILRQLYMTYAVTSKTTNEITLTKIQFMRNSLVELYRLEPSIAYQQCFIFMRQLTINLRKSVMVKEKDALKRVHNWQFIHSLNLWSQLIGTSLKHNDLFDQLLTPVTNISLETLRLFSAFKYVTYRLQIIELLVKLSSESGYFIPILRTFLEIIVQLAKNKREIILKNKMKTKTKKKEIKPIGIGKKKESKNLIKIINLNVTLKTTKEQILEMDFIQKLIDKIYELLLYYLKSISHRISFPEIILIFHQECRKQIKSIPYVRGQTMMKQLMDKCDKNAQFIIENRKRKNLYYGKLKDLIDQQKIESFENEIRNQKTPLIEFYEQWRHLKSKQSSTKTSGDDGPLELAENELITPDLREFDIGQDIEHNDDENVDDEELNESELDELDMNNDDEESIEEFGEDDEVELTEEQMKKIQAKIEKVERKLSNNKSSIIEEDDDSNDAKHKIDNNGSKKRKRKRSKKNRKKVRGLNPNLQLEGAFDLSSDDDE
ncbi:nucleolar complex protein 2 [Dermatophagoides pteronyssinus]|uniref:nucleolar complex protein 2 n=1 Tax=Dermatophagoides pteronyssinus TaxID=6956 RepID=UPI003F67E0B1